MMILGTIIHPKTLDGVYNGVVIRPLRCINPEQEDYSGLIQMKDDNSESISQHKFGITSLTNKRDLLQKDDIVVFKIDEAMRAVEVRNGNFCKYQISHLSNLVGHCCPSEEEGNR